jgi:hypothetical protein
MRFKAVIMAATLLALGGVVSADSLDVDQKSWGIRLGLAADPDQVLVGGHFLRTRIDRDLFLEPNAELGFGDDHTMFTVSAPVHYQFRRTDTGLLPYAGGGVTLGWDDDDDADDTDFDIALRATGGVRFRTSGGHSMFGELNIILFGDLHDAQAMVGWHFQGDGRRGD